MDPAPGCPSPGAPPGRLVGRPSSSGPRGGSRWPVSKEKKKKSQNFYYLHVWAKVQSIIQAPGPGGCGRGAEKRKALSLSGPGLGRDWARGGGSDCAAARSPGPAPLRGRRGCGRAPGPLRARRPLSLSASGPPQPPSPAGGPGRPAEWGRRSLATVSAGGSHQRGDGGDLGAVLLPGLQILQSKQRRVVQTERVGLDGVVEALLEGVVLQLQHEPARLLPLRLPLLRRLPPAPGEGEGQPRHAPGTAGPPAGPQPSRERRPAGSLEAQDPSTPLLALCARGPRVRGAGCHRLVLLCAGWSRGGDSARRPPARPGIVASPATKMFLLRDNKGRALV